MVTTSGTKDSITLSVDSWSLTSQLRCFFTAKWGLMCLCWSWASVECLMQGYSEDLLVRHCLPEIWYDLFLLVASRTILSLVLIKLISIHPSDKIVRQPTSCKKLIKMSGSQFLKVADLRWNAKCAHKSIVFGSSLSLHLLIGWAVVGWSVGLYEKRICSDIIFIVRSPRIYSYSLDILFPGFCEAPLVELGSLMALTFGYDFSWVRLMIFSSPSCLPVVFQQHCSIVSLFAGDWQRASQFQEVHSPFSNKLQTNFHSMHLYCHLYLWSGLSWMVMVRCNFRVSLYWRFWHLWYKLQPVLESVLEAVKSRSTIVKLMIAVAVK